MTSAHSFSPRGKTFLPMRGEEIARRRRIGQAMDRVGEEQRDSRCVLTELYFYFMIYFRQGSQSSTVPAYRSAVGKVCTEHTDTWYTKVPSCTKRISPLSDWKRVIRVKVFHTALYRPVWAVHTVPCWPNLGTPVWTGTTNLD
ncbi:hypothetical protein GW17_00017066 [Ensete ventricosum]|nr:hypothetical protein GW17_00017066 [Ensete ventricosum]